MIKKLFSLFIIKLTLHYFNAHRTFGRSKTGRKSIDERSKNICRGPIVIVSKKNNFRKQLHYNIEEKRLLNLPSKKSLVANAYKICIIGFYLYFHICTTRCFLSLSYTDRFLGSLPRNSSPTSSLSIPLLS